MPSNLWVVIVVCAGIGLVAAILVTVFSIRDTKRSNKVAKNNYENAIMSEQSRVSRELGIKNDAQKYYSSVQNQLEETKQTLRTLYCADIVHPQYRNIVAVASIYQYIDTGRCTVLQGHEGAYNLYESERRLDKIITQLDEVISQLDAIKNNQYELYNAMRTANDKIDRLTQVSQMSLSYSQATAQNSEIIAYNSYVSAKNTEFLKWMEIFRSVR